MIVEGVAEQVTDAARLKELLVDYTAKYGTGFPADSPVFRISPRTVFGFTEYGLSQNATRWRFPGERARAALPALVGGRVPERARERRVAHPAERPVGVLVREEELQPVADGAMLQLAV